MAKRLELIECWLSSHRAVTLKHIRKEGNKVADLLANMGVDCRVELHAGPISSLASESQLSDYNNLVKKEMHQEEGEHPAAGEINEI